MWSTHLDRSLFAHNKESSSSGAANPGVWMQENFLDVPYFLSPYGSCYIFFRWVEKEKARSILLVLFFFHCKQ